MPSAEGHGNIKRNNLDMGWIKQTLDKNSSLDRTLWKEKIEMFAMKPGNRKLFSY